MFSIRRILSKGNVNFSKRYISNASLVEVKEDSKTGIYTLSMARAPVNSLNLELLTVLNASLKEAEKNGSRGVILTSSLPTVFSAGLDIMEMYKPDMKRAADYWSALQDTWMTLYNSPLPVACAINGASPAGGCLLAMSCEYRVFVKDKYTIGLNETQLGIVAPKWFQDVYINTIGYRQAELALLRGTLFSCEDALKIGLVDELASDKADAITKCQTYIAAYKKISSLGRGATKQGLRRDIITWLQQNRKADAEVFLNYIKLPKVQEGLHQYIQYLKQRAG